MADYDVSAIALASPPASAPVTDYRPGISVKNLGIHAADVTGYLNVYDRATGLLVDTFALAASDIAPGETRTATAATLWQPTEADIGKHFLFTGYINYPPDQILTNNQLQPVDVLVTAEEPPPPPPVEAHAAQHEDGGGDEINLEGLTGKLAEAQTPAEHASNHESGGSDEMSVEDLTGLLATPQTPALHASSHIPGGADPVPPAAPAVHGATLHDTTVEATANKGVANGYASLDAVHLVPITQLGSNVPGPNEFLRADQTWAPAAATFGTPEAAVFRWNAYAGAGTDSMRADAAKGSESGIASLHISDARAVQGGGWQTVESMLIPANSTGTALIHATWLGQWEADQPLDFQVRLHLSLGDQVLAITDTISLLAGSGAIIVDAHFIASFSGALSNGGGGLTVRVSKAPSRKVTEHQIDAPYAAGITWDNSGNTTLALQVNPVSSGTAFLYFNARAFKLERTG